MSHPYMDPTFLDRLIDQQDSSKDTSPIQRDPTPPSQDPSERYSTAGITLQPSGRQLKVMVASTPSARAIGLQNTPDLQDSEWNGMLFQYPADARAAFQNANVPYPVSVQWFDSLGMAVDHAHMAPQDGTPVRPAGPHRYALEVHSNDFDDFGLGPGSSLQMHEAED